MCTLKEAQTAKLAMQETIALALRQFTADTGLVVDQISMERIWSMGGSLDLHSDLPLIGEHSYLVSAEVRL